MGIKPNLYTYPRPKYYYKKYAYALAHETNLLMYLDPKKYIYALKQKFAIFSLFSANTTLYKNSNFVFVLPMKNSILL